MQAFLMMWVLPLTFVSSAFVQVQTMPGWLQAFAANQPVTSVINTMRALAIGGPVEANLLKSFAWLAGICLVFLPLAVRAYRRAG
jgi:ABC-type multidrug transport system permease subunit